MFGKKKATALHTGSFTLPGSGDAFYAAQNTPKHEASLRIESTDLLAGVVDWDAIRISPSNLRREK